MHANQPSPVRKVQLISRRYSRPALADLRATLGRPQDIVESPHLTLAEKVFLLRDWAYDACELAVAEEEGMGGGVASDVYSVMSALNQLTGGCDVEHTSPTKHAAFAVR